MTSVLFRNWFARNLYLSSGDGKRVPLGYLWSMPQCESCGQPCKARRYLDTDNTGIPKGKNGTDFMGFTWIHQVILSTKMSMISSHRMKPHQPVRIDSNHASMALSISTDLS